MPVTDEALDRREDHVLLARTRCEPDAFAVFYRRHVDHVLGYFARRVRRGDLALDLTAETFAAALSSAHRYRGTAPADAWLFTIAHHTLARSARRGRVDARLRQRLAMEPVQVDDEALERVEQRAEAGTAGLLARLATLPESQRRAVEAHVLDERDYADIAAELQCSPQVVRQRVSRGLRALRVSAQGGTTDA